MSKFKKGDIVIRTDATNPIKCTVEHVAGSWMWIFIDGGSRGDIRPVDEFELWEPFRVGFTYISSYSSIRIFDCHFIGNIGAVQDNKKYAAGQLIEDGRPFAVAAILFRDGGNWTEI